MSAKEETLASILSTKATAAGLPRSRAASVVATKLEEAELWMRTIAGPESVHFILTGDVIIAEPVHGEIRIELTGEEIADCKMTVHGCTPIRFNVIKPHDQSLVTESTEVAAAVYWSRCRVLDGRTPGSVTVT